MLTPDQVTDSCIATLATWHPARLAAVERDKALPARTLPRLNTGVLAAEGFRVREDRPPIALLGTFGTTTEPLRDPHGALNVVWTVAMELTVMGQDREDTVRRRDWYTMVAIETLLQYLPREADPVDAIVLADIDLVNGEVTGSETLRHIGQSRVLFDVTTRQAISLRPEVTDPADLYLPPEAPPVVLTAEVNVTQEVGGQP